MSHASRTFQIPFPKPSNSTHSASHAIKETSFSIRPLQNMRFLDPKWHIIHPRIIIRVDPIHPNAGQNPSSIPTTGFSSTSNVRPNPRIHPKTLRHSSKNSGTSIQKPPISIQKPCDIHPEILRHPSKNPATSIQLPPRSPFQDSARRSPFQDSAARKL